MRPDVRVRTFAVLAAVVLGLGLSSVLPAHAQATAAILGAVMDPTGAAIGGAMIQVKNTGTGLTQTAVSDEQGAVPFSGFTDRRISSTGLDSRLPDCSA